MRYIILFILFEFAASTVYAQIDRMPHVSGQVLVQLRENGDISRLETDLAQVNGNATGMDVMQLVSAPMHIWLLSFDESRIDEYKFLDACWRSPFVTLAQFNHIVEDRIVPNDPNIGSQWQWVNNGSGGTADADVDADEAWDITTGGVTAHGDTIVVCVLEGGGSNYNHPDLIGNHWRNYNEIPNNGIDDDSNGYVDDFDGWNTSGNDNIAAGGHGTGVSGMIGAKGNNGIGVTGINWDVKIMQVDMGGIGSGSNPNEAEVIAAYTYPLVMRKLYNASNGSNGAFVVATNASWGIDQGDPANAPMWCAFYDTLGIHGVLNCGATTNSALNVDVVGDLPTACASDYMISVTATNNSDVRTFSGYGQTTIDLAAPGASIYTTSGTSSYGSTSGTSFATPLTAGVIALMYSVQCPSFMNLVKTDPQAGADYIRTGLFASVDLKPNLTTETVTGGRVNAYQSVLYIQDNCSPSGCSNPFSPSSFDVQTTQAMFTWVAAADSFVVRYRVAGSSAWDSSLVKNDSVLVDTLMGCTTYEYQVATICLGDTSIYSAIHSFTTDGCCDAPSNMAATGVSSQFADIEWMPVTAAISYELHYRPDGGAWSVIPNVTSPYALAVDSCATYAYSVATVCASGTTYGDTLTLKSKGCGACEDNTYCSNVGQSTQYEWIESVQIGNLSNNSGNDAGYGDYTGGTPVLFYTDSSYNLTLTPGFSGSSYNEYFKVYIDLDQDGTFNSTGEEVYDAGSASSSPATGSITIPGSALEGITRLRVVMKYVSTFSDPSLPAPCTNPNEGEIEDYCIQISTASSTGITSQVQDQFRIYPNPSSHQISIETGTSVQWPMRVSIIDTYGRTVLRTVCMPNGAIDVSQLANGTYILELRDNAENVLSRQRILKVN